MLINVRRNALTGVSRDKNEYWEKRNITPNEAYQTDSAYQNLIRNFASYHKIKGPFRFFEVRIIAARPSLICTGTIDWWDDPEFMDKCFWMFQTPMYEYPEGKEPYGYYYLEPFECRRVLNVGIRKHQIVNPTRNTMRQAFVVPIECCQLAWTETSGGYSDHLHHRPEILKTQEQLDREKLLDLEADKLLESAEDIVESPKWKESLKKIDDGMKRRMEKELKKSELH